MTLSKLLPVPQFPHLLRRPNRMMEVGHLDQSLTVASSAPHPLKGLQLSLSQALLM